ncbi:MAG: LysM peptidoglycan-binding domain-containing protein [Terrimicrobiaceae bacterium]
MLKRVSGIFLGLSLWGGTVAGIRAQQPGAPPVVSGIEPGLEEAVKWKWRVVPSPDKDWGLELPDLPPPVTPTPQAPLPRDPLTSYEVKKGDALVLIAKKTGVTVAQLKAANGLTTDTIRIGQALKIPTLAECLALGLPPAPPSPPKSARAKPGEKPTDTAGQLDQEVLLLQVFLDRENFSSAPIDGKLSLDFQKLVFLYQNTHGDVADSGLLKAKALAGVGNMIATYTLRREDFRFIAPPKAEKPADKKSPEPAPKNKSASKAIPKATPVPPPTYPEMTSSTMLAYRSPWEFVAEKFHCREDLLHLLNPGIRTLPSAGTEFQVPNVIPFQIENAFSPPLRPAVDPQNVITAVIVDLSSLEIYSNDRLVAAMPVAAARPGLRGKGTWKILESLPRPRLATLREPRELPKQPTNTFFTGENPTPSPTPPVLTAEQYLPAGPNNPVGILWINLSKTDNPDPLPYGLHGTGIPSQMKSRAGIGGFRLTNWDIIRAARLLPVGTALVWKQAAPPPARTATPSL